MKEDTGRVVAIEEGRRRSYIGEARHSLSRKGDGSMEVKHTHPTYKSGEERREQLADAQRVCLKLIRDLRGNEPQRKERTA